MNRYLAHGGNLEWAARVAKCQPDEILDFSANINPLGCPSSVMHLLRLPETIERIRTYPDPNYTNLKAAIASHHGISPDLVLPGNGAAELLTWACRDLALSSSVTIVVPSFGDYLRALKAASASIDPVRLAPLASEDRGDCFVDLAPLFKGGDRSQTRGLLLNNPHNPTGKLYARGQLLQLLDRYDLVAIDEAFMDFLVPEESQSLIGAIAQYPHLVIIRSLTKFYALPGLRIGYAIAHPERLARWQTWRDPWSVNCLAEQAAIASLKDREFQQQTWDWLPEARLHLYEGLSRTSSLHPLAGAANFLLVESAHSVIALRDYLLQHHRILIRDCHSFPELGDRYLRLCIRTPPDHQRLFAALREWDKIEVK